MPYKDPGKRRDYAREYGRLRRAGGRQTPGQTLVPLPFRLRTAHDILALLAEQVAAVRAEADAGTLEKARTVGYLSGIALKTVEVTDLEARLKVLEDRLAQDVKLRRA